MSQTFQKGNDVRVANTAADEVALRFKGFVPVVSNALDTTVAETHVVTLPGAQYRDLQAAAKEAGIPANQSAEELLAALDAQDALDGTTEFDES